MSSTPESPQAAAAKELALIVREAIPGCCSIHERNRIWDTIMEHGTAIIGRLLSTPAPRPQEGGEAAELPCALRRWARHLGEAGYAGGDQVLSDAAARLDALEGEVKRLAEQLDDSEQDGCVADDRIRELTATVGAAEQRAERYETALREYCIVPEHDYPADAPVVVGYNCIICNVEGPSETTIDHKRHCALATTPRQPEGQDNG